MINDSAITLDKLLFIFSSFLAYSKISYFYCITVFSQVCCLAIKNYKMSYLIINISLVFFILIIGIALYNSLVRKKNDVENAFASIMNFRRRIL